ncbi:MAG: alginate lyase [Verrucomicrobiales bacterium]|nr:alginate lyase [Verrucomicrobiales bacterium]
MNSRFLNSMIFLAGATGTASAQIPATDLPTAANEAKPGTEIIVANGSYPNHNLAITAEGTKDAPVVIRAQTPGGVIFSGQSALKLRGRFVVLSGFHFKDGFSPEKYVVELDGENCRLTQTVIEGYNPSDPEKEDKWISLKGQNLQVDSCTFLNKTSPGVTLAVWCRDGGRDQHLIAANLFLNRPKGHKPNGFETIRIGDSKTLRNHSMTVVQGNLFEACDGEMEIISVKCGRNTIRGNTFMQCAGTLTLRHGNASLVEGNLFAGKRKKETGGIRVYGKDHVVRGNAIIGTMNRGEGAIALQAGNPNPEPHEYHRAESIRLEKNLIVANEGPAVKLDAGLGKDGRTLPPTGIIAHGNGLSSTDLENLIEGLQSLEPDTIRWEPTNTIFHNNQVPREVTKTIPPPLKRTDVGAKWFRPLL